MSVNRVILLGNIGSDPEVRSLDSGKKVATFSLATSEQYRDKITGEKKSVTEWHKIVLWGSLAELAGKYLKKGSRIYLEAKIKTRSYETGNGEKKYTTEIIGDQMTMLGEKPQPQQSEAITTNDQRLINPGNNDPNDLPF